MKKNTKNKHRLPAFCKRYFWDVDFGKLDYQQYPDFVITRLLEYGDPKSLRWLLANFSSIKIKNVLKNTRNFSTITANFWADFFNLDKQRVLCLKKSFRERQKTHWSY